MQTVQLVRLAPEGTGDMLAMPPAERMRRRLIDRLPFLALVVIPTVLAALYCFGLATSRYQSELKYVVRTPASAASSELASLVSGSNVTRSGEDGYLAKEYMLSRDAMEQLINKDGLLTMFGGAGTDVLWRTSLLGTPTTVDLVKHYLKFVSVEYDSSTGISTLGMQAFTPEDAQRLAGALVDHTEVFLNHLNDRAQQDAVNAALRDVDLAKQTAYDTLAKVTAFRNAEETVDPTKASTGIVASISALTLELSTGNARLAELMTSTPQSPEIPNLRTRIAALQDQVLRQRQQLGGDSSSLAPRIERYQRLLLEQGFAEKAFISALTSLEAARLDASRQRVFIERVTEPDLPDRAAYPYRLLSVLATFALGFMVWKIFSTIGKDTREHGRK